MFSVYGNSNYCADIDVTHSLLSESLSNPSKTMYVNVGRDNECNAYNVSIWGGRGVDIEQFDFIFPEISRPLRQPDIDATDYERQIRALPEEVRRALREWTATGDIIGDNDIYSDGTPVNEMLINFELNSKLARGDTLSPYEACAFNNLELGLSKLRPLKGDFIRVVEHNKEMPAPWVKKIQLNDMVTPSPCLMSASMTLQYAMDTFENKYLLRADTSAVALYKIHCSEDTGTAVPLLRGTLASPFVKENEVLFSHNSCFRVEGIAMAQPVNQSGRVRFAVLLTQVRPDVYAKNIFTGELVCVSQLHNF